MKFSKYHFVYYILLLVLVLLWYFLYKYKNVLFYQKKVTIAKNNTSVSAEKLNLYISWFYDSFVNNLRFVQTKNDLAKFYCQLILKNKNLRNGILLWDQVDFFYSPTKSLWFYLFCKDYIPSNLENYFSDLNKLVKSDINFISLKYKNDPLKKSSAIFNILMNDLFNLKLMNVYSFQWWNVDIQKYIKQFSDKYFGSGRDICWSDDKFYLFPKQTDYTDPSDKSMICSHPLTYKYLAKVIKQIVLIKNNLKLINLNWLKNSSKNSLWNKAFVSSTSQTSTDFISFYNILLNEYFWYSRWLNYYKFVLINKAWWISSWVYYNKSFNDIKFNYEKETQFANDELIRSWKAITMSIRILKNLQRTFPIHIWLTAYFEDLVNFRKKFVQLYTPFDQLYYKLRNVEDLDR